MQNQSSSRRDFIRKSSLLSLAGLAAPSFASSLFAAKPSDYQMETVEGAFTLPPLPYPMDALEPHIDKLTMQIHHDKHHQGYVNNLNNAVEKENIKASLEDLVKNASKYSTAIRNNAGGHWNHSMFWKIMKPNGGGSPPGKLASALAASFNTIDGFTNLFNDAASKRFGSGWAWLVRTPAGKLEIGSTPNQDNPMMDLAEFKGTPIMGIDVWEHAYYLKYQNKRADYINAWWNVINWDEVAANLAMAEKMK